MTSHFSESLMKTKLWLLFALLLFAAGCASLQNFGQAAEDFNKTMTDPNRSAQDVLDSGEDLQKAGENLQKTSDQAGDYAANSGSIKMDEGDSSDGTQSANCCVNGAYYECPDAGAASVCIGEPMSLMSCLNDCSSSSCEQSCLDQHGPDPSQCTRDMSRDGNCK